MTFVYSTDQTCCLMKRNIASQANVGDWWFYTHFYRYVMYTMCALPLPFTVVQNHGNADISQLTTILQNVNYFCKYLGVNRGHKG